MAYAFEGNAVNMTNLASGNYAYEPTAAQRNNNRIICFYRKDTFVYLQYSDDRGDTWEDAAQILSDSNARTPDVCYNYNDGWALVWGTHTDEGTYEGEDWEIKFCQALAKTSIISDLLESTVEKGIDVTASGLRIIIANEDNAYDFQKKDTIWENQIVPGSEIEFYVGLGSNLNKRFKGEIDSAEYKDGEGIIEIVARGKAGILIDSKLVVKRTYSTSKTYKEVAEDLFKAAGFESDEYYVEDTTVTLAEEKIFDREETYYAAFQNICEDMGWIIWEDEDGKVWLTSPTNYPVSLWNYFLNINAFSWNRALDRLNVPYKVVIVNEDTGIEKEAIVDAQTFASLNQKAIDYQQTEEDDGNNVQQIANNIANDYELKLFTVDIIVPYNFYLQVRDRVTLYHTHLGTTYYNVGIVIRVTETFGRKGLSNPGGMFSNLTIAVIS